MLEVLILTFVLLAGMAKARRRGGSRRAMGAYIRGNVDEELALGTLAAKTLVLAAFDEVVSEKTFVSSLVATWTMTDLTEVGGDGPIMVGVAHSDYTAAEVEEWIENTGSWNEADMIQQREVGRRLIRRVGVFQPTGAAITSATVLNAGRPIKTKLNWTLISGQTLDLWAYNMGSSALETTDPQVRVQGHVNLWSK